MTSMERVLRALQHQEPDQVPLLLTLTMHGAKELGMSIKEYYSAADHVIEGQRRLQKKYRNDCYYTFTYAAVEVEAYGGDVIFCDDGPPNSGTPIIQDVQAIRNLEPVRVAEVPCLQRLLTVTEGLHRLSAGAVPVIGVVISPFSVPVMQFGFERYIELIYEQPLLFERLMQVNETFCVEWANAQLAAGATAICYFDPLSSPTMISRDLYRQTGYLVAQRVLSRIQGPTVIHLASGRCMPVLDDLLRLGVQAIGVSTLEDLGQLKANCAGKTALLGNLNGLEMWNWTPEEAEAIVKATIAKAGPHGGFLLADNHGEIPYQVTEETLQAIALAVEKWGRYPLEWTKR
ncbi:uroporphyrinogen decarboxylase family protein [Heliophilum fasciatum]|uniref:Uroporphyrinogen decarboxylase n=1 Tax=Heliophilum fasciatum TaxID=35700 RepID=A0A4R2RKH6_9FIRM|nr:uroporphyrinogen decarboxylase family protein [Heliophilum fasciatum]MCW2278601.1 uroporphyrinogen decarboxylase [Heliophilum fasciatum]TCP62697.1 uroporphyrinogen decarboxylase [Heliophilum fasciatum]